MSTAICEAAKEKVKKCKNKVRCLSINKCKANESGSRNRNFKLNSTLNLSKQFISLSAVHTLPSHCKALHYIKRLNMCHGEVTAAYVSFLFKQQEGEGMPIAQFTFLVC